MRRLIENTLDGNRIEPEYGDRMPADVAERLRERGIEIPPELAPRYGQEAAGLQDAEETPEGG
jgi:hypothetical protein